MIISHHPLRLRLCVLFLALLNSGCISLNRSATLGQDLEMAGATGGAPVFAGELGEAIREANIQRNSYFDAVDRRVIGRQMLGVGLIGLSAVAVYRGANAVTDGERDWLTRAGAIGAGAYTAGQYVSNNPADEAFLDGYRAITCSILRSRPLLFDMRTGQKPADEAPLNFFAFNADVSELKHRVDEADHMLSAMQVQQNKYWESLRRKASEAQKPADPAVSQKSKPKKAEGAGVSSTGTAVKLDDGGYSRDIAKEFAGVVKELKNARLLLKRATALQYRVGTSGYALRRRVELVVGNVAGTVQKNQPDLPKLAVTLKTISDTANSFSDLKPVPIATGGASDDDTSASAAAEAPAAKATEAAAGGTGNSGGASQCKAPTPSVDAAAASVTETKSTETKTTGNTTTTTEKTTKQIVTPKPADTKSVKLAVDPAKLDGYFSLQERKKLRERLSEMYKAHNHLNYRMAAFQEVVKSIKNIPVCDPGSGAVLKVFPDTEELNAQAGQNYKFLISGGTGIPKILLMNAPNAKDTDGVTLTTTLDDGQVVATLSVPQDAKAGEVLLHIADGEGLQIRDITINIDGCSPPAADAAKAKT